MRACLSVCVCLLMSAALWAQTTPEQKPPVDSRKSWSAAFTALTPHDLPPEEQYLAFSIPLLLKNQLASVLKHTFSDEEMLAYQKQIISLELGTLYKSLAQLRQQRDEALFASPQDPKAAAAAEKKLTEALDRIRWLEELDPALVKVEREKPIAVKEGTGVGNLFDPPSYSQYQYAVQIDTDLMIGGTASDVQGYILMDLWAYSATLQKIIYTFRDAAKPEEIYSSLEEAGKGLVGAMLGREWAALTILPDPPQCTVTIDGDSMGEGKVQSAYLTPGKHIVEVTAPGYESAEVVTTLAAFEDQSIPVSLVKRELPKVSISTIPPGASVYLDSVWMGTTPLVLELPPLRSRLQLDLDGYYSVPMSLGPASPPELAISLQRDVASRTALQTQARDRFYTALGFFALSLPIPLFSYSYRNDYLLDTTRFPAGTPAGDGAAVLEQVFKYGTWGGAAVSAGLFTWMIIDLVKYITIANRTAG